MTPDPIKISYDDLKSESVEGRLREQSTVRSTKDHYERADVVAPQMDAAAGWRAALLKSIVYLALFGLCGGAIGAAAGEWLAARPDRAEEASQLIADLKRIDYAESTGRYTADDAAQARHRVREIGQLNDAFLQADLTTNGAVTRPVGGAAALDAAIAADHDEAVQANRLLFTLAGLLIAAALASADRVVERDVRGGIVSGVLAGIIGAGVGVTVARTLPWIESRVASLTASTASTTATLTLAAALVFLGASVGIVPGIVMRNSRRTTAGFLGGLGGGVLAALTLITLSKLIGDGAASRVIALAVLGAAIGLAMGLLEDAAKQGWLRVASGLIAGKQFILYRNPTFVGSAPMSHIYLFRDPQVGRRHAAIFQVTGGYEIENLPLGGPTLVNGQPVARTRLKRGDRIGVGRTTLIFDERIAS